MTDSSGNTGNPYPTSSSPEALRSMVKLLGFLLAGVITIVGGVHLVIARLMPHGSGLVEGLVTAALIVGIGGPALWFLVISRHLAAREQERAQAETERRALEEQTRIGEFDGKLHRAFEIAHTEGEVTQLLHRVLSTSMDGCAAELLLADSSDAPLKRLVGVAGRQKNAPMCPVAAAGDCVAAREGKSLIFSSSDEIDACPKLHNRPSGVVSAICVPVAVSGRSIGVLHATRPVGQSFSSRQGLRLGSIAELAAHRLGIVRTTDKSRMIATVDGLTGVLNRRGFETRAGSVVAGGERYAVIACDLDKLKPLNDKHGHEAGNRALNLFARALKATFRTEDVVARRGGGEFMVVIPGGDAATASQATERLRSALAEALLAGTVPLFTCSYGVADSTQGESLEDVINAADGALSTAKRGGRDCARIAGSSPPGAAASGDAAQVAQVAKLVATQARGNA